MTRCLSIACLLLTLLTPLAAFAETTYTCPQRFITRGKDGSGPVVVTDLKKQSIVVSMNLYTDGPKSWFSTADMSTVFECKVLGTVTKDVDRVLLSCSCSAVEEDGVSPSQTAVTLERPADSQCTYDGDLKFTCK